MAKIYVVHHMEYSFDINLDPDECFQTAFDSFTADVVAAGLVVKGRLKATAEPSTTNPNWMDVTVRGIVSE